MGRGLDTLRAGEAGRRLVAVFFLVDAVRGIWMERIEY